MGIRFVIKHLSVAVLTFLVLATFVLCFYDDQKWMDALYFSKISFFIAYVFWIIQNHFKNTYISGLAILMYVYFGFDLFHNLYYVYFGGWNELIDQITHVVFIVGLIILLIWLRITG